MKLLAIDSSTEACSVALLIDNQVSEVFELAPRAHTQRLLPMVDELMAESGLQLNQLDAIGFSCGPGSFTGLRICAGVVQGLAFGVNVPVVPVSTLAALAQTGFDSNTVNPQQLALTTLDARMDEVYWGVYCSVNGLAEAVQPDQLSKPESIQLENPFDQLVGLGSGWVYGQRLPYLGQLASLDSTLLPKASGVARLAQQYFKSGRYCPADQAIPVYLRNEVAWQKQP